MKSAIFYTAISDHLPVVIHLKTSIVKNNNITSVKRVFDSHSVTNFNLYLNEIDWSQLYRITADLCDALRAHDLFYDIYSNAFEFYFPLFMSLIR